MARGGQGKGGGKAQMAQPPVTKYRKNIGTYDRDSKRKVTKRDYRDKADARKDRAKEGMMGSVVKYVGGLMFLLMVLYAMLFYLIQKPE